MDFITLLKELNKKRIKYIVVGGIAINLHGIPRMTYDLDLILDFTDSNIIKFVKLFKRLGYKPRVPVKIMDFAKKDKRERWIKKKNMKAFNLFNPSAIVREVDIIMGSPVDYKIAKKNVIYVKLQNTTIPVIGIKDLIKMKKVTNRLQDNSDIRYLRRKV